MTTTVTVSYALIATSNKLWLSNGNGDAAMLAYAPAVLAASGMPAAGVAAKTESSAGLTFDPAGNLWALGSTTADAPIARYPAASLGASGVKMPDIEIDSPSFGGGSPGPKVLAFDRSGNLWTTVGWADKIVKFNAAQIAASGNPTKARQAAPRTILICSSPCVFLLGRAQPWARRIRPRMYGSQEAARAGGLGHAGGPKPRHTCNSHRLVSGPKVVSRDFGGTST